MEDTKSLEGFHKDRNMTVIMTMASYDLDYEYHSDYNYDYDYMALI